MQNRGPPGGGSFPTGHSDRAGSEPHAPVPTQAAPLRAWLCLCATGPRGSEGQKTGRPDAPRGESQARSFLGPLGDCPAPDSLWGGPTKLSHAGPGWAGWLAQASLTQMHSGRGPREGWGGPGSTHGQEGSQDSGRGTQAPTCPLFRSLSEGD